MFKKTLVAAALAGALVGSAFAANVTLYGVVDEGLLYKHTTETNKPAENTFTLDSGVDATSRFGLKGTEELGNGYAVSFILENSFAADDGTLGNDGRLFGREASLTLSGPFGALSFGRMGGVGSSAGSYDLVYGIADALDGGGTAVWGLAASDRYDNMVTYQTPKFGGVQATAQYSFKEDNKSDRDSGTEGKSQSNRYASFALTAEYGNFQAVAAYELQARGNTHSTYDATTDKYGSNEDYVSGKNQNTFYLGGNYDFGVAKVFALAQYFNGAQSASGWNFNADGDTGLDNDTTYYYSQDGFKGFGLHLGTVVPVFGGDATVAFYYTHAKADDASDAQGNGTPSDKYDLKSNFYGAVARYEYPLSKRTTAYTGVEYSHQKVKFDEGDSTKYNTTAAYVGLTHKF